MFGVRLIFHSPFQDGRFPMAKAALLAAGRPMDAAELARGFKGGGKRIQQGVVSGLNTLVRYGWVTAVGDGRFVARRAA